jgi:hypothetical protein
MSEKSVNGYTIRVEQTEGLGTTWVVRVSKKRFLFRKSLSSDWFLDGVQAARFADQVAADLGSGKGLENLRDRKPGWTLHRPVH